MFNIKKKLQLILSIPKTLYFNLKVLPLKDAIKFPFIVYNNVKIGRIYKNVFYIDNKIHYDMVRFGEKSYDSTPEYCKGLIDVAKNSKIVFKGEATFASGINICTHDDATIEFGDNFYCNKNCVFESRKSITIGDNVLIGWNVNVIDSDGKTHVIFLDKKPKINKKEICIGNHVWICSFSHLLKGSIISDNSVVAYNSCVNKAFDSENVLIGGYPAKIIQEKIDWKR